MLYVWSSWVNTLVKNGHCDFFLKKAPPAGQTWWMKRFTWLSSFMHQNAEECTNQNHLVEVRSLVEILNWCFLQKQRLLPWVSSWSPSTSCLLGRPVLDPFRSAWLYSERQLRWSGRWWHRLFGELLGNTMRVNKGFVWKQGTVNPCIFVLV